MRKLKNLTSLFFMALTIGSCTDSNDDVSSSDQIQGMWTIEKLIEDGSVQTLDQCELLETINFTSEKAKSKLYSGQYCEVEDEFEFNYTIDSDKLRVIIDLTEVQEMTISKLNSNQLILKKLENGFVEMEVHYKR